MKFEATNKFCVLLCQAINEYDGFSSLNAREAKIPLPMMSPVLSIN